MYNFVFIFLTVLTLSLQLEAKSPLKAQMETAVRVEQNKPKAQEVHEKMLNAFHESNWAVVIKEAKYLQVNYQSSPLLSDAYYYMGVASFNQGEFDAANNAFTDYLKLSQNLRHFEDAVTYKFEIAKAYESGMKKRLFGLKKMPKIMPAKDEALTVFDEVISAMPRSELACQSLYRKAGLLVYFEDYKDAIEMYQTLIRRFPKNTLAARSFYAIADIYLKQCQVEFPDPALIELAEINLKRFQSEYPAEPLILDVKQKLVQMKGVFAEELFTVGNYFIKKKKYDSAFFYFKTIITKYPDTKYYDMAYKQLSVLKKKSGRPNDFDLPLL